MNKYFSIVILINLIVFSGCISFSNYWNSTVKLIDQNQFSEAEQIIRGELEKSPSDPLLHFRYGLLLFRKGSYIKSAIQVDSSFLLGLDLDKAQKEAEQIDLSVDMIYYQAGVVDIRAGDYQQALEYLNKTSEISPYNAVVFNLMGYAHLMTGNITQAESLLWVSYTTDSLYNDARYNLCLALFQQEKYTQVVNLLEGKADNPLSNFLLASSYLHLLDTVEILNQIDMLETMLTRAMEDSSAQIQYSCLYNLGMLEMLAGNYSKAEQMFHQADLLGIASPMLYYNYGVLKMKQGDYLAAKEYFTDAITFNPYFADAYTNRGICETNLGNSENARLDFIRGMELRKEQE